MVALSGLLNECTRFRDLQLRLTGYALSVRVMGWKWPRSDPKAEDNSPIPLNWLGALLTVQNISALLVTIANYQERI